MLLLVPSVYQASTGMDGVPFSILSDLAVGSFIGGYLVALKDWS